MQAPRSGRTIGFWCQDGMLHPLIADPYGRSIHRNASALIHDGRDLKRVLTIVGLAAAVLDNTDRPDRRPTALVPNSFRSGFTPVNVTVFSPFRHSITTWVAIGPAIMPTNLTRFFASISVGKLPSSITCPSLTRPASTTPRRQPQHPAARHLRRPRCSRAPACPRAC